MFCRECGTNIGDKNVCPKCKTEIEPIFVPQITINEDRFKILMEDIRSDTVRTNQNAMDLDVWVGKLRGNIVKKDSTTKTQVKKTSLLQNMMDSSKYKPPLPKGGHQELVKGVISECTMHNLNMSEDTKIKLRKIAVESYDKKLAPRDIAKEMTSQIDDLSIKHAQLIARTETMRAANLSSYINAKLNMHARSFTVHSDPDCCPLCAKAYDYGNIVFSMDQNDMIPPIHDECGCVPLFSMMPVDGSSPFDVSTNDKTNLS
jgi:hypothetical protein